MTERKEGLQVLLTAARVTQEVVVSDVKAPCKYSAFAYHGWPCSMIQSWRVTQFQEFLRAAGPDRSMPCPAGAT